jgi:hypothetical protein
MTPDYKALREAAEKATPGPWLALPSPPMDGYEYYWVQAQPNPILRGFTKEIARVPHTDQEHDAIFIAAANPSTIISLLDALAASEAKLEKARDALGPLACTCAEKNGDDCSRSPDEPFCIEVACPFFNAATTLKDIT